MSLKPQDHPYHPLVLQQPCPNLLEVRGEVYMDLKDFRPSTAARGGRRTDLRQPRNATAGSLRQLN
jgi:DNA ligase (NAD+)